MNDIKKYLPKSRDLFRKFMNAHFKEYWEDMRRSRVGPGTGYWYYYRNNEVIQHIRDISHNLEETFGYVTIPGEFTSPKLLVNAWIWFYDFLKSKNELFENIINAYKKPDEELPEPFHIVHKDHNNIVALMEEIVNMQEVKQYLQTTKQKKTNSIKFDIIVITAIHDTEFEALKNLPVKQVIHTEEFDSTSYRKCQIGKKSVLFATDDTMGMAAAASLSTKLIAKFSPSFLIMAGIAAGVKDNEKNYGDILVAKWTFNYESGKYKYNQKLKLTIFEPDPKQIEISGKFINMINDLKSDNSILNQIKESFIPKEKDVVPTSNLKIFIGPLASGSAVVADKKRIENIRAQNRKLIGIDMETYGVMYAANSYSSKNDTLSISIKSISDFADQRKSDKYRNYAAHTSANFIYYFILNKLQ